MGKDLAIKEATKMEVGLSKILTIVTFFFSKDNDDDQPAEGCGVILSADEGGQQRGVSIAALPAVVRLLQR